MSELVEHRHALALAFGLVMITLIIASLLLKTEANCTIRQIHQ